MSVGVPALPLGVDPLIAEAKQRARRRRLIAAAAAALVAGATAAGVLAFGAGGSSGEIPWLPTRPNIGPANPPLAAPCTASQLKASLFMQGASMSLVGGISILNRSAQRCALVGRPKLSFSGATAKWRESRFHAQSVEPIQFDPLAPSRGTLRALRPGEHVSVNLWWSNWCGRGSRSGGDPGLPPAAMVLTAPGGGSLRLHNEDHRLGAPVCNGVGVPSTLQAGDFTPYVPQGPPNSALPLTARIVSGAPHLKVKGTTLTQPAFVAAPGSWLSFTVVLTNRSRHTFTFGRRCPAYVEGIGADENQAYILNCRPVRSIASGQSVRFAMRVHIPQHAGESLPALGWTLAPHTFDAPQAPLAIVQLR